MYGWVVITTSHWSVTVEYGHFRLYFKRDVTVYRQQFSGLTVILFDFRKMLHSMCKVPLLLDSLSYKNTSNDIWLCLLLLDSTTSPSLMDYLRTSSPATLWFPEESVWLELRDGAGRPPRERHTTRRDVVGKDRTVVDCPRRTHPSRSGRGQECSSRRDRCTPYGTGVGDARCEYTTGDRRVADGWLRSLLALEGLLGVSRTDTSGDTCDANCRSRSISGSYPMRGGMSSRREGVDTTG